MPCRTRCCVAPTSHDKPSNYIVQARPEYCPLVLVLKKYFTFDDYWMGLRRLVLVLKGWVVSFGSVFKWFGMSFKFDKTYISLSKFFANRNVKCFVMPRWLRICIASAKCRASGSYTIRANTWYHIHLQVHKRISTFPSECHPWWSVLGYFFQLHF